MSSVAQKGRASKSEKINLISCHFIKRGHLGGRSLTKAWNTWEPVFLELLFNSRSTYQLSFYLFVCHIVCSVDVYSMATKPLLLPCDMWVKAPEKASKYSLTCSYFVKWLFLRSRMDFPTNKNLCFFFWWNWYVIKSYHCGCRNALSDVKSKFNVALE